jgi:hypothetical protein
VLKNTVTMARRRNDQRVKSTIPKEEADRKEKADRKPQARDLKLTLPRPHVQSRLKS